MLFKKRNAADWIYKAFDPRGNRNAAAVPFFGIADENIVDGKACYERYAVCGQSRKNYAERSENEMPRRAAAKFRNKLPIDCAVLDLFFLFLSLFVHSSSKTVGWIENMQPLFRFGCAPCDAAAGEELFRSAHMNSARSRKRNCVAYRNKHW